MPYARSDQSLIVAPLVVTTWRTDGPLVLLVCVAKAKSFSPKDERPVLVIVLLIFGASRLTGIGKGLGGAISAFRSEVKKGQEDETRENKPDTSKAPAPETEAPEEQA